MGLGEAEGDDGEYRAAGEHEGVVDVAGGLRFWVGKVGQVYMVKRGLCDVAFGLA